MPSSVLYPQAAVMLPRSYQTASQGGGGTAKLDPFVRLSAVISSYVSGSTKSCPFRVICLQRRAFIQADVDYNMIRHALYDCE